MPSLELDAALQLKAKACSGAEAGECILCMGSNSASYSEEVACCCRACPTRGLCAHHENWQKAA